MAYEVSQKDIKKMKELMTRLETKKFTEDDNEELTTLSSRFLFFTRALAYCDGYTLKK